MRIHLAALRDIQQRGRSQSRYSIEPTFLKVGAYGRFDGRMTGAGNPLAFGCGNLYAFVLYGSALALSLWLA